ncbi:MULTISPECIES: sterol desaturase family protein [Pseudomonas]|jgi:sterol desaturase/sphingolipid hydroxylase (fatty acid hydroxylase superfamily)|uniref:Sterol desaturase family protein n=1 Tax=Pseudomonas mandelii TaxID=75612 RepID=A0AB36CZB9_9PSED|nr:MULTISPECIES: sterol desaturase family protein [Pseudomonas]NMZ80331.1 sterol desaturase family protein [Pseudomonas mandelii]PMV87977.1 fatty acid hydroxylase [Pseudomonas sp. GW101-1A09]PMV91750.1 fatty acid hydroxylase [Pseudomonas sp. FW306-2-2C-B10A]PMW00043.1 fatty acid hydroxylase [Pseudomonas sp. GW460-C8]PMW06917.1 fatty acid hydroxylase [Pseudomonas sp. MPR-TSA4]
MNTIMLANNPSVIVAGIFLAFILLELACSSLRHPSSGKRDVLIEVIGSGILVAITFPSVMWLSGKILSLAVPEMKGALATIPWVAGFVLFLVLDDMTQYWWHRLTHRVPALYALHRAHHSAPYMSVRIVYRNNSFYYMLMPGIWLSGILIYLGLAHIYYVYLILKMIVIFAAHSSVAWDDKLYGIRVLRPIVWVLERTISTPSTHSAHHGLTAEDGVTHYKGNFGNLLFFWDILFGTAKITRRRPPLYGIEHLSPISWKEELFWPIVRSRRVTPKAHKAKQKVAQ